MSIWDLLDSLPKRGDVSPEELAARRQGYADLYQGGLLARNSDQEPLSVSTMRSSQDFIPVIGDTIALGEAGQALSRGELAAAGVLGTGALVGLVPGAGPALARPIMAAGRKMADAIPSDAIYAGRSLAEGDMRGVLDAITPGRPAQGLGADAVKPSAAELRRQANIERFGYDPNEPPAPAPAPQAGSGILSDYVGQHQAPTRGGGAPAFNLAGDIYPDDIYSSKAVQYYGTGSDTMDEETMRLLQSLRGSPDADVTIYRAVPRGVDNLNAGDWVTVNKQYAKDHGESALGGDFDVIEKNVKARDIFTNGDSIHEFGYDPAPQLNPAQQQAQGILDMLSDGRGADVTDEMMTAADDAYLFNNYDLPMDEASRMGRATDMGFDGDMYHGTTADFQSMKKDIEFYTTPDADYANIYAGSPYDEGGRVLPLMQEKNGVLDTRTPSGQAVFDDNFFMKYGNGSPLTEKGVPDWTDGPDFGEMFSDNSLPYNGVFLDEGKVPLFDGSLLDRGVSTLSFDPTNIRSRFARFDPRLAHLRNLSAGVGGFGLLSQMPLQEEQY